LRFFILDRLSHHAIHLNDWSEIPRPPLPKTQRPLRPRAEVAKEATGRDLATGQPSAVWGFMLTCKVDQIFPEVKICPTG
jgi:hypothetical protein